MAYTANASIVKTKGNGTNYYGESQECVAAVKYFCQAPQTSQWRKGTQVKNNHGIKAGTAIATFISNTKYDGHAAVYIGQNTIGLQVYDQWRGRKFQPRTIRFNPQASSRSNDGDQFYVVD